jgi:hypothetical protein
MISKLMLNNRTKKDFSTAILEKKKAPYKLTVEDAKNDDNSVIELTQAKMDELKIFKGDTVIIKGNTSLKDAEFTSKSYAKVLFTLVSD